MSLTHIMGNTDGLFLRYSPGVALSACIGIDDRSREILRIAFNEAEAGNILIVGRSATAALGIYTTMILDLASQIVTTPNRKDIYTSPPFSVLEYLGTEEARIFTEAAMGLPLSVKLERATDTEMTTLNDFQHELDRRRREPDSARHSKFMFLSGLQAAHGVRNRGFYVSDLNPQASKFIQILHGGTAHSLHAVVWCNSFANIGLTMSEGLTPFRHVIVLAGADRGPFDELGDTDGDQSWYVDRHQGSVVPMIPFALPTETWCDSVIGALG